MRQSSPEVHTFFDEATNAACHIVKDPASNAVAIIDSILDLDAAAGRTETTPKGLKSEAICEVSGAFLPHNSRKYRHSSARTHRR